MLSICNLRVTSKSARFLGNLSERVRRQKNVFFFLSFAYTNTDKCDTANSTLRVIHGANLSLFCCCPLMCRKMTRTAMCRVEKRAANVPESNSHKNRSHTWSSIVMRSSINNNNRSRGSALMFLQTSAQQRLVIHFSGCKLGCGRKKTLGTSRELFLGRTSRSCRVRARKLCFSASVIYIFRF